MLGVVKLVPVPKEEPPVEAAYQLIVPADAVAPKVTVPVPHRAAGVVPVRVGVAGWALTTAFPEAAEVQPTELVTVKV